MTLVILAIKPCRKNQHGEIYSRNETGVIRRPLAITRISILLLLLLLLLNSNKVQSENARHTHHALCFAMQRRNETLKHKLTTDWQQSY